MRSVSCFIIASISLGGVLGCTDRRDGKIPGSSSIASGWSDSNYRLSYREATRLKDEALRAKREGNREVCGAILQRPDGGLELCFADNESRYAHSYKLSDRSVRRMEQIARETGTTIIGSFHSHPSGGAEPGRGDLTHAGLHNILLIHSVPTGETKLWKVVLRDGRKKAQQLQLQVIGRRTRGPSPLPPSRTESGPGRTLDLRGSRGPQA